MAVGSATEARRRQESLDSFKKTLSELLAEIEAPAYAGTFGTPHKGSLNNNV